MRSGGPLPEALLDVQAEQVDGLTLVKPRDWDELRHQEGGAGRSAPYWALAWPSGRALAEALAGEDLEGRRVLERRAAAGHENVNLLRLRPREPRAALKGP